MMLAHVWPIVAAGKHSDWGSAAAIAAFALALPGSLLFARGLPGRIHGLVGIRIARLRGAPLGASAAALAVLVALPILNARPVTGASSSATQVASASRPAPAPAPAAASAERDPQPVTPGAREALELELDGLASREDRPVTLELDAKAIAADPADGGEERASTARKTLHLVGSLLWIGYDEARRRLAEEQLVDAVSGAAWQTDVGADGT